MEPYDQGSGILDETGDETFGDDTLDDTAVDDTEDYSMMESGVGESEGGEPQAGTSGTDGTGEGQGTIYFEAGTKNPKIIVDDHDFYLESSRPTKSTWFCCMNYKTKCKVRVSTSGTYVVVNGVHNHLPRKRVNAKYRSKEVTIVRAS